MAVTQTRGIWVLVVVPNPFSIAPSMNVTSHQRVSSFEVAVTSTGNVTLKKELLFCNIGDRKHYFR